MHRALPLLLGMALVWPVHASTRPYAGAIGGISTLSADAGSSASAKGLSLSAYSPKNGPALNLFAGVHLHDYFSLQLNYVWNRNQLIFNSTTSASNTFYQQARSSSQQAGIFDFLLYFRPRKSWIRPYLGTGGGVIHLSSRQVRMLGSAGTPVLPPSTFSSTRPVFRSHVGMDIRLSSHLRHQRRNVDGSAIRSGSRQSGAACSTGTPSAIRCIACSRALRLYLAPGIHCAGSTVMLRLHRRHLPRRTRIRS